MPAMLMGVKGSKDHVVGPVSGTTLESFSSSRL